MEKYYDPNEYILKINDKEVEGVKSINYTDYSSGTKIEINGPHKDYQSGDSLSFDIENNINCRTKLLKLKEKFKVSIINVKIINRISNKIEVNKDSISEGDINIDSIGNSWTITNLRSYKQ